MTRFEALCCAIQIVEKSRMPKDAKLEVVKKLELCKSELPFSHWSEEAIFDACDEFIRTNGRGITMVDFERPELPSHPVIKNRFGITAKEFRDRFYPLKEKLPKSRFANHPPDYWTKKFIEEYNRIKPTSQSDYNKWRDPNTPGWATIAKMNGVSTWSGLQEALGLRRFSTTDKKMDYSFTLKFAL